MRSGWCQPSDSFSENVCGGRGETLIMIIMYMANFNMVSINIYICTFCLLV